MLKANNDLRMLAKGAGIPLWKVANELGISEGTLLRNWRTKLGATEKNKIVKIIERSEV